MASMWTKVSQVCAVGKDCGTDRVCDPSGACVRKGGAIQCNSTTPCPNNIDCVTVGARSVCCNQECVGECQSCSTGTCQLVNDISVQGKCPQCHVKIYKKKKKKKQSNTLLIQFSFDWNIVMCWRSQLYSAIVWMWLDEQRSTRLHSSWFTLCCRRVRGMSSAYTCTHSTTDTGTNTKA